MLGAILWPQENNNSPILRNELNCKSKTQSLPSGQRLATLVFVLLMDLEAFRNFLIIVDFLAVASK